MINNYKMITLSNSSQNDLKFIEFIRMILMFGVVENHVSMHSIIFPNFNPIYIDQTFSTSKIVGYMSGNPAVQTFFVISGFLTSFNFIKQRDKVKNQNIFKRIFKSIFNRFLRLTPILIFMILIHSSMTSRWCNGPFCDHVFATERNNCRKHWWRNLLFINNYFDVNEICVLQSWYLSADFWLHILAMICLELTSHNLKLMKIFISCILATSFISYSYSIYSNNLEPISLFTPE